MTVYSYTRLIAYDLLGGRRQENCENAWDENGVRHGEISMIRATRNNLRVIEHYDPM
jgi:hypothetical protein